MIRGLLYKFHKWVWNYEQDHNANEDKYATISPSRVRESGDVDIEGLRFTVMPARGGTIIQMRTYDRRKDESNNTTYIIPDGEDIATEVGRIVSMEMLKAPQ
jgi:hypothetical protein